jgi:hypothetical protein
MAIRVTCSDPGCRRKLSVRDGLAGKAIKCPDCGAVLKIPSTAIKEARAGSGPSPGSGEEPEMDEHVEPATADPLRDRSSEAPLRMVEAEESEPVGVSEKKIQRIRRLRDETEEEEPKEDHTTVLQAVLEQGIALFLLFLLAMSPLLAWLLVEGEFNRYETIRSGAFQSVYVHNDTRLPPIAGIASWQGKAVLAFSLLVALFAGITLLLRSNFEHRWSDHLLTVSRTLTGAWASFVLVCLLGVVLKAMLVSGTVKTDSPPGEKTLRVVPHLGIWFGVVVTLVILGFSFGFSRYRGRGWWLIAQGVAVLMAVLVVLALVQPWTRSSVWGLPLGSEDIHELKVYGK